MPELHLSTDVNTWPCIGQILAVMLTLRNILVFLNKCLSFIQIQKGRIQGTGDSGSSFQMLLLEIEPDSLIQGICYNQCNRREAQAFQFQVLQLSVTHLLQCFADRDRCKHVSKAMSTLTEAINLSGSIERKWRPAQSTWKSTLLIHLHQEE